MQITNMTNSPYDLINDQGEKVRLPARGSVIINPHHMHLSAYRRAPYFKIEEVTEEEIDDTQSALVISDPAKFAEIQSASPSQTVITSQVQSTIEPKYEDVSESDEIVVDVREQYKSLTGKKADGRWSDERVAEEIKKLKA